MSAAGKHSQPYPWEQVEFGHKIYRRTKSEMSSNKLPGVEYEDINSGQGTLNKDITKKSIRKRGIFFQPFDVLFGKLRPYLKNWLYPNFKGVAVGDFWVLYSKLLEPSFIYGMIQTQKFQNVANLSSGSKMPRSDWKLVSRTLFRFPMNKNEQRKIGLLLLNLDKTITLHEEKQRQLEQLKKALLQKMFADETGYPVLRFKGFTEKWEQVKLSKTSRSYSGGTPKVGVHEYYDGQIPFIRSGEIASKSTELTISKVGLNNSSAKLVSKGDILYALYGATSGEVSLSKINGAINQAILAIKPIDGYENYFLMTWLQKEKEQITRTYLQGGQGNLSAKIVMNLVVNIPSLSEQSQIAQIFSKLDKTITLHDKKIQYLKQLKRGLLQKMFV